VTERLQVVYDMAQDNVRKTKEDKERDPDNRLAQIDHSIALAFLLGVMAAMDAANFMAADGRVKPSP
jgi:hypothetical protein